MNFHKVQLQLLKFHHIINSCYLCVSLTSTHLIYPLEKKKDKPSIVKAFIRVFGPKWYIIDK